MRRWFAAIVVGLAIYLVVQLGRQVEPERVLAALRTLPPSRLLLAAVLTICSYVTLTFFDRAALKHLGIPLPWGRVSRISFIAYTFNFNFGVILGGMGVRYRLYRKLGLTTGDVARVSVYAMTASFVSFFFLASLVHFAWPLEMPAAGWLPFRDSRPLAGVELALGVAYLAACRLHPGPIGWRRWSFRLPELRAVLPQLLPATVQWLLLSGVLFAMLPTADLPFREVLGIQLFASIIAVVTHVPAGLGTFEATLLAFVPLPKAEVFAAALAFRALYHWLPLAVAACFWALDAVTFERRRHEPAFAHTRS